MSIGRGMMLSKVLKSCFTVFEDKKTTIKAFNSWRLIQFL